MSSFLLVFFTFSDAGWVCLFGCFLFCCFLLFSSLSCRASRCCGSCCCVVCSMKFISSLSFAIRHFFLCLFSGTVFSICSAKFMHSSSRASSLSEMLEHAFVCGLNLKKGIIVLVLFDWCICFLWFTSSTIISVFHCMTRQYSVVDSGSACIIITFLLRAQNNYTAWPAGILRTKKTVCLPHTLHFMHHQVDVLLLLTPCCLSNTNYSYEHCFSSQRLTIVYDVNGHSKLRSVMRGSHKE